MNKKSKRRHLQCLAGAIQRLLRKTEGQDLIEYALMAAVVAIAAGAFIPPLGDGITTVLSKVVSIAARVPG